ncbi:hypothetical protein [Pinibacter aurantiacus]|uniref:Glycosyltransferase RgtA/B/C/D-like domain-containing protein n=1 Tax=Pinibacter aurantiacus TaxID=2851599 RepID=A0A9E2W8C5_9BACT|nr:hypothetical protein [Pinibacter aurantiacus]MBV4358321.1 hypothetical protein [Pinibacter aurantiacus]
MIKAKENYVLPLAIIAFIIGKIFLLHTYFFWDSTQALSVPATYLYDHNFSNFNYPNGVADPPLIHFILALSWKFFGRSLVTSHVALGLFSIGCFYQVFLFCKRNASVKITAAFLFLLMILDASFLTQTLLLFPDIFLFFFSFLSINLYQKNKRFLLSFSLLFLSMCSLRAFSICGAVGLAIFFYELYIDKNNAPLQVFKRSIIPFLPAIAAIVTFFVSKKITTGSFFIQDNSLWKGSWELVGIKQFLGNIKGVIRFMLDNGTIAAWIALIFAWSNVKDKKKFLNDNRFIIYLFASTLFVMSLLTLPFTNSFGKRYFILPCIFLNFLAGKMAFEALRRRMAIAVCVLMLAGMISSHFWKYPERFSTAWDCSLGHLPYYRLRQQAIDYVKQNNIDPASMSFFFPGAQAGKYIELNDSEMSFAEFDLSQNTYATCSNISNRDIALKNEIVNHWQLVKTFSSCGIYISIYKRPGR